MEKRNIDIESSVVSGIIRSIPSFIIGGPFGLFANTICTILNVYNEKNKEDNRCEKRKQLLNTKPKKYYPTSKEMEIMMNDYIKKFYKIKTSRIYKMFTDHTNISLSMSNNEVYDCSFEFNNKKTVGKLMCPYDFWVEFYKNYNNTNLKIYKMLYGTYYMAFTINNGRSYFLSKPI